MSVGSSCSPIEPLPILQCLVMGNPPNAKRRSQLRLLLEEIECLLNEDAMVLEYAAVPGVRENAQLCFR